MLTALISEAVISLMFATLPVRRDRKSEPVYPWNGTYDWQPSNAAQQASTAAGAQAADLTDIGIGAFSMYKDPEEVCEVRHLPKGESHPDLTDGCGNRSDYLELLGAEFRKNHVIHGPLAAGLKQAFETQLMALKQDARTHSGPGRDQEWLPSWTFKLPPYTTQRAQDNVGHNPGGSATPVSLPARPAPGPSSPDPADPGLATRRSAVPRRSRAKTMSVRISRVRNPRFFTIGEVGDHLSAESFWVLADDGSLGYDVFDATGQDRVPTESVP